MTSHATDICKSRSDDEMALISFCDWMFVNSRPEMATDGRRWATKLNQTSSRIMDIVSRGITDNCAGRFFSLPQHTLFREQLQLPRCSFCCWYCGGHRLKSYVAAAKGVELSLAVE